MSPEQIERLKRDYTDQFVEVTGDRPDHSRFVGAVGQVKTVNMNGRALVEFAEHHKDIGWYDIDLDFLKVVEKPRPVQPDVEPAKKVVAKTSLNAEPKPSTTQSADGKKLSPLEMARQMGGTKAGAAKPATKPKPAPTGKLSPIEQLKQMGAKRGSEAAGAVAPKSGDVAANPSANNTAGLSPIEILRQMGGSRGKSATDESATPAPTKSTEPMATSVTSEPIPPECTPEPLRRAREIAAQRGPAKETGYPTTADIFAIAQGIKPAGWKPTSPEDSDETRSKWAKVRGGKVTANDHKANTLSTADIWAISKGELRIGPTVDTTAEPSGDVAGEATEPSSDQADEAGEKKMSTADILAQLRGKAQPG